MATILQVRTLVDDPSGVSQIFDDTIYQTIIDIEDNVYRAAATAAKALSAHYALKVSVTAGPVKIQNQQKADQYLDIAKSYDQRAREGGGSGADTAAMAPSLTGVSHSDIDDNNNDTDRYKGQFSVGMDDNPQGLNNNDNC
jgi:hypothetical protein